MSKSTSGYGCGTLIGVFGLATSLFLLLVLFILFVFQVPIDYAKGLFRIGTIALLVPLGITFEIVNSYFTKAARYKEKKQKIEEDKKEEDLRTKFR